MKILYLEDDLNLSQTVEEFLSDEGYEVLCVYDGDEALKKLYSHNFDLLIFDVQVPQIDGFSLLKLLREANITTPTIFTTSRNSLEDLSFGYDVGGDDYLKKPFALKELLFRIKAILKREYKTNDHIVPLDATTTFDINLRLIHTKNQTFEIHQKEAELLKLLLKNQNHCVDFEVIFETVWSFDATHSEQSLRTYIKNLRKIVGKERIISIKTKGYMFV